MYRIQKSINWSIINNGRGTEISKKEKEVLTKRDKERNRQISRRNREIVQYPLSQSGMLCCSAEHQNNKKVILNLKI